MDQDRRLLAIADRIKAVLKAKGWTQRDLARKMEMTDSYVSEILAGKQNLTIRTISALEKALGTSLIDVR